MHWVWSTRLHSARSGWWIYVCLHGRMDRLQMWDPHTSVSMPQWWTMSRIAIFSLSLMHMSWGTVRVLGLWLGLGLAVLDLHTWGHCSIQMWPRSYCVQKLCTVMSTLRWAVLTVLWIGFCHTGPISLWVLYICCIIVSTVGWTWWDWSLILRTYLPSVLWHCWLGHLTHDNPSPI